MSGCVRLPGRRRRCSAVGGGALWRHCGKRRTSRVEALSALEPTVCTAESTRKATHHCKNAETCWRTWNHMWCKAKERAALPVSLCSDPGSRNGRASSRCSMCCLAGDTITIMTDPERWCTGGDIIGLRAVLWVPSTPSLQT